MSNIDKSWYNNLAKSKLTPPDFVFPIVWTILYMMIIASFIVYLLGNKTNIGFIFFGIQMVLNLIWSPVFFRMKNIKLSLMIIILMWAFILITIIVFYQTNPLSSYLLIPYFIWVSLATYLNIFIFIYN